MRKHPNRVKHSSNNITEGDQSPRILHGRSPHLLASLGKFRKLELEFHAGALVH